MRYEPKYELVGEPDAEGLRQIRALRQIGGNGTPVRVTAGTLGGWVSSEESLDHLDEAWVDADGRVRGTGRVCYNARVTGTGVVGDGCIVGGSAIVAGSITDGVAVSGNARIRADSRIKGDVGISDSASIVNSVIEGDRIRIRGDSSVHRSKVTHDSSSNGTLLIDGARLLRARVAGMDDFFKLGPSPWGTATAARTGTPPFHAITIGCQWFPVDKMGRVYTDYAEEGDDATFRLMGHLERMLEDYVPIWRRRSEEEIAAKEIAAWAAARAQGATLVAPVAWAEQVARARRAALVDEAAKWHAPRGLQRALPPSATQMLVDRVLARTTQR